jgi:hypothetical protein
VRLPGIEGRNSLDPGCCVLQCKGAVSQGELHELLEHVLVIEHQEDPDRSTWRPHTHLVGNGGREY